MHSVRKVFMDTRGINIIIKEVFVHARCIQ